MKPLRLVFHLQNSRLTDNCFSNKKLKIKNPCYIVWCRHEHINFVTGARHFISKKMKPYHYVSNFCTISTKVSQCGCKKNKINMGAGHAEL